MATRQFSATTMTTIAITNQYTTSKIEGSKKQVINRLRDIALEKRKQFRELYNIPLGVHRANTSKNEIVNVASFEINRMGIKELMAILNYGVEKYTIIAE